MIERIRQTEKEREREKRIREREREICKKIRVIVRDKRYIEKERESGRQINRQRKRERSRERKREKESSFPFDLHMCLNVIKKRYAFW